MADIGAAVGNFLPFDPTPNFQLSRNGGAIPGFGYDAAALGSQYAIPTGSNTQLNLDNPFATLSNQVNSGYAPSGAGGLATGGTGGYYGGYSAGSTYDAEAAATAAREAQEKADTIASLTDQQGQLGSLLGRTQTGLDQGISKLDFDLQEQNNLVGGQQRQATQNYGERRVDTNKEKQSTYDKVNQKANNGYRSLAQIIGRAGGTGSSAFQNALPDAIGKETSGDRKIANETYGNNMGRIQKSEDETSLSFSNILADLQRQRQAGERDLRTGIEGQRQNIGSQQASVAAQLAQAQGGDYAAARAASAPYQTAIDNSRNSVEGFFNSFKPTMQAGQATIARPDMQQYSVDRSDINAGQAQGGENMNPYADMLRRRLKTNEGQA